MNYRLFLLFPLFIISSAVGIPSEGPSSPSSSKKEADLIYRQLACPELNQKAFRMAYEGYQNLDKKSLLERDSILTVIDFSKPSTEERFYIIDLKHQKVIEKTLVAHGKNSGLLYAEQFSNTPYSNKSSLGFYITSHTYSGKHGYSLRIKGVEPGINENAWKRAIVIHGADYVSRDFIKKYGRLGRSFGCPALSYDESREIINQIKDASCLFIYSEDASYEQKSGLINSSSAEQKVPQ